jgi:PAS domain S-box-containing protein
MRTGMNAPQPESEQTQQPATTESALDVFLTLSVDLVCICGQDGYFKRLNPAWEKLLGWTQVELRSHPWIEFVHPDDVQVTQTAKTHSTQENLVEYENRYRHKNGSYRWLSWRGLYKEDGLFYGIAKDITTAKQAEAVLKDSDERFRSLSDCSPVGINEQGIAIGHVGTIKHISDRKQAEAALQQAKVELETTVEKRTAQLKQAIEQLQTEIGEHQRTEAALLQREEQFRRVFYEAPIGMALLGWNGRIFRVNQALCKMLGYTQSELIGLTGKKFVHPEDWERKLPYLAQLRNREIESFQLEERFLKKNQEILWGNLTSMVMRDEEGEILYGLAMIKDITEHKVAEVEILKALEQERELSQLRSSFISLVSHEFRTPLTTIQSSTELLERYSEKLSDDKKLNHLIRIQSAVQRMTQLLDDVLTIGKAEAGKLKFEPAPIDLEAFCRYLVENMQAIVASQHINANHHHRLTFVTQGNFHNAQMDEKLLEHIITNLLSNAIKYSTQGGTVQFELICDRNLAIFRIQDNGIGIPQKDLQHLFESFGRASNVGNIPGTGLGLAIVKQCVDLHKGKIAVESEVGFGTTFTVTLPLHSYS